MNQKIFTILICLSWFYSYNLLCQPTWHFQAAPVQEDLISVSFADSIYGWAISESAQIIHTSDGGGEWKIQNSIPGFYPSCIFFQDRLTGWIAGSDTNFIDSTFMNQ